MKIFATRVWGFDPTRWPVITFALAGNRDWLLKNSSPGDRIVFVGTQAHPTSEKERGRLLGIAEIGRRAVNTLDVIDIDTKHEWDHDEEGNYRFPEGILMIRAWRFTPQPILLDVLEEQLSYMATPRAVELSTRDAAAVLALPSVPLTLPSSETLDKARLLDLALNTRKPTTGPTPTSWTGEVQRDAQQVSYTYACQFGRSQIWKIGHTIDLAKRVEELNQHIPVEVLPERWSMRLNQRWPTALAAYEMEQRILKQLTAKRTSGERLQCTEGVLRAAWLSAIGI